MSNELFSHITSTTVSSGGTTAPAAGTQQTWTVASSAGFPGASSSANPPTRFKVVDPAESSEVIDVINVSGTTWTVLRGAEGTTPVAHTAGFSVSQVVTAGWLSSIDARLVDVKHNFNAVGDGTTDDTTAFTSADNAGVPVYVPAGTYYMPSYLPSGLYYGPGELLVGSETIPLDLATPQRVDNNQFGGIGSPRRLSTAVGQNANANADSTRGANAAFGHNALASSVNASRTTALGSGAMHFTEDSTISVAIGTDCAYGGVYNDRNTWVGTNAGKWAGDNDPILHQHDFFNGASNPQLYNLDVRWPNIRTDLLGAIGSPANLPSSSADNASNVGIGRNALLHSVKSVGGTAVGYNALAHGYNVENTVAVGRSALRDGANQLDATAVGAFAGEKAIKTDGLVAIGYNAAPNITFMNGVIAIGANAMQNVTDTVITAPDTPTSQPRNNIAIGTRAMQNADATSGQNLRFNVGIGTDSLASCASFANFGIGSEALQFTTTGSYNVGIGHAAGRNIVTGSQNVAIGGEAMQNVTGGSAEANTAVGFRALRVSNAGSANTAVGWNSLIAATASDNNTGLGYQSLGTTTTGSNNTGVGHDALRLRQDGTNMTVLSNSSGLGSNARVSGSNQVQLGSSGTTTYVYGTVQNRSDIRDKAEVRDTTLGLDFINKLRPVDFKWDYREDYDTYGEKDGSKVRNRYHHGVIAQEVERIIEETGVDFGGYQDHALDGGCDVKSIGYDEFIGPLIKAVQELSAEVERLKQQLNAK